MKNCNTNFDGVWNTAINSNEGTFVQASPDGKAMVGINYFPTTPKPVVIVTLGFDPEVESRMFVFDNVEDGQYITDRVATSVVPPKFSSVLGEGQYKENNIPYGAKIVFSRGEVWVSFDTEQELIQYDMQK